MAFSATERLSVCLSVQRVNVTPQRDGVLAINLRAATAVCQQRLSRAFRVLSDVSLCAVYCFR
jgi:hypothetical protein